jgi:hypothetical protein
MKVMFNCTPYVVNVNLVADQCPSPASGTAVASQVLSGYTFSNSSSTGLSGSLWIGSYLHTGQTTSYGTAPDDVDKDGNAKSYTVMADGNIKDNFTGLIWMKDGSSTPMTWEQALSYCNNFGGGWRLPSIAELATFADYNCSGTKAVPSGSNCLQRFVNIVFTATNLYDGSIGSIYDYWSSTTVPGVTGNAYILGSYAGYITASVKTISYGDGARCVRSP